MSICMCMRMCMHMSMHMCIHRYYICSSMYRVGRTEFMLSQNQLRSLMRDIKCGENSHLTAMSTYAP